MISLSCLPDLFKPPLGVEAFVIFAPSSFPLHRSPARMGPAPIDYLIISTTEVAINVAELPQCGVQIVSILVWYKGPVCRARIISTWEPGKPYSILSFCMHYSINASHIASESWSGGSLYPSFVIVRDTANLEAHVQIVKGIKGCWTRESRGGEKYDRCLSIPSDYCWKRFVRQTPNQTSFPPVETKTKFVHWRVLPRIHLIKYELDKYTTAARLLQLCEGSTYSLLTVPCYRILLHNVSI